MPGKTKADAPHQFEVPAFMRLWGLGPLILNASALSILTTLWPQITADWFFTKIILNAAFLLFALGVVTAALSLAAQFLLLSHQSQMAAKARRAGVSYDENKGDGREYQLENIAAGAGFLALLGFVLGVALGMLAWLFVKFDKLEATPARPAAAGVTANVRVDLRPAPAPVQGVVQPPQGPACPPPLTQTDVTRITEIIERTIERTVERQCPSS
jgi:hypothetical protein